ncbi:acyl-CoA dehydrogenase [Variovorax sp. WS11]|uniref:FAS1-like dehydratase domain-containing protein n=1 Tax=Variovorax sp. WS11 TaxID=1105204 RepID=UPI000D0D5E6E|nr:MaoC family dehydratase N-terminal domain-containing protein [Variovorax sp. WS11]NDZ18842.1 acyl-CoA dehydrogenase [Variovorax sp. WS11]PSL79363.1 acyl-CoA dehydrogenase [Variovorax sp. WS11]
MTSNLPSADFQSWLGRSMTTEDEITAFPINALAAVLDREPAGAHVGITVPPLWHWLYFLPLHRPGDIRHDGHARGGDFMPPIPLPRRMWAGSKFIWNQDNPLRVGDKARRISRIDAITPKTGKTGELVFVKVVHEYHNEEGLCFTNEHNSAFRGAAKPGETSSTPVAADTIADWRRELTPDALLLFRYSALAFNSHRIHYDYPYATQQEKYPTLLVQGPLIATLLMDLLHRNAPHARILSLDFKAVRPTFMGRPVQLRGQSDGSAVRLWASDDEGQLTMSANVVLAA